MIRGFKDLQQRLRTETKCFGLWRQFAPCDAKKIKNSLIENQALILILF